MSLSRLALRLAAVEALCPSARADGGPYPTSAGKHVYDSRILPIADADGWQNFVAEVEGRPLVTVYTEEQETEPTDGEYPADRELVELVVEIMIAAGATVRVDGPNGEQQDVGSLEAAISSPEHEALLDLIDQQVRDVLDPTSPVCPEPYSRIAWELRHVRSAPWRDAANRLSRQVARTLTFKLRVPQPSAADVAGIPADIAGLPQPLLMVAQAVAAQSPGGQLLRSIAASLRTPGAPTRLADIRVFSNLDRDAAPGATGADLASDARL